MFARYHELAMTWLDKEIRLSYVYRNIYNDLFSYDAKIKTKNYLVEIIKEKNKNIERHTADTIVSWPNPIKLCIIR